MSTDDKAQHYKDLTTFSRSPKFDATPCQQGSYGASTFFVVEKCQKRHLEDWWFRKMIKRYGRQVGIQVDGIIQADGQKRRGVGVHSLRKTVATEALRSGADIRDVQKLLGHESITTTQIYTENTGDEAKRAQRHLKFG